MCHFYQRKESGSWVSNGNQDRLWSTQWSKKWERRLTYWSRDQGKHPELFSFQLYPADFSVHACVCVWNHTMKSSEGSLHGVCSVFRMCLCERNVWWVQGTGRYPLTPSDTGPVKSRVHSGICTFWGRNASCEPSHEQSMIFTFQIRKPRGIHVLTWHHLTSRGKNQDFPPVLMPKPMLLSSLWNYHSMRIVSLL